MNAKPDTMPAPVLATPTIFEAIVRQRCLSVTYNRTRMILAPHVLYTRDEKLYVDARVVSRENMLPREEKFGTYRVDGLKELKLVERPFEISPLFDRDLPKYVGETLMAVEPADSTA